MQDPLPIWLGVGGTPESFARAGTLGLPLMVAIIGRETRRFRPLVDLYREYGRRAGHAPDKLKVGVHALGYVAETPQQAIDDFFPGYAKTVTRIGGERGWPPVSPPMNAMVNLNHIPVGTSRCDVPARAATGGIVARLDDPVGSRRWTFGTPIFPGRRAMASSASARPTSRRFGNTFNRSTINRKISKLSIGAFARKTANH